MANLRENVFRNLRIESMIISLRETKAFVSDLIDILV